MIILYILLIFLFSSKTTKKKIVYFENSNIISESFYVNKKDTNIREGYYISFNKNGDTICWGSYNNNQKVSDWFYYSFLKYKIRKVTYKSDTIISIDKYTSDGHLIRKESYKNGNLYNIELLTDRYGVDLDKGTFHNGNGKLLYYNDDGILSSSFIYNNGIRDGQFLSYWNNDSTKIKEIGYYSKDFEDSIWVSYAPWGGDTTHVIFYDKGKKVKDVFYTAR